MTDKQVVTLIAPRTGGLSEGLAVRVGTALEQAGATLLATHWLEADRACDIAFIGLSAEAVEGILRPLAETAGVDAVAQPVASRRKKLLICDMDSTIIQQECIDELADFAGFRAEVSAITERAMNGELDFAEALRARVKLLAGLEEAILQQVFDERITLMPGARALVMAMKSSGARCLLVSGGFTFFTGRVAEAAGFDAHYGNTLEIRDGKLTGQVAEPILGREAKLERLNAACTELGIAPAEALAVGDGANDLPMLLAAGLGVAYHAKPVVRHTARAQINFCDLSALLFVQGVGK